MRLFPWRRRHLDERVRVARAQAEQSRQQLEQTRAQVVRPLREAGERNHFADMIRASLTESRGHT